MGEAPGSAQPLMAVVSWDTLMSLLVQRRQ